MFPIFLLFQNTEAFCSGPYSSLIGSLPRNPKSSNSVKYNIFSSKRQDRRNMNEAETKTAGGTVVICSNNGVHQYALTTKQISSGTAEFAPLINGLQQYPRCSANFANPAYWWDETS